MTTLLTQKIPARAAVAVTVLALVISLASARGKSDPVAAVSDTGPRAALAQADLDPAKLQRAAPAAEQRATDPFAATRAPAASPPASQPPQPSAPVAPALPFRYLGKAVEDGQVAVFLERGNENYSVAQGGQAGRDYRVEQITDASVTFTYLPLGQRQTLAVPARN
ncbi:MAG TPA: hypothetical protein VL280_10250 [Burkholderiales bacterium]|nr:hypothetical protein [Burkholderiales bacterium]